MTSKRSKNVNKVDETPVRRPGDRPQANCLCTFCFAYIGTNIGSHTCEPLKERILDLKKKRQLVDEMRAEYQVNVEGLGRNLYLCESHFNKSVYNCSEVKSLLTTLGHKFVPQTLEHVFPKLDQQKALIFQALDASYTNFLPKAPVSNKRPRGSVYGLNESDDESYCPNQPKIRRTDLNRNTVSKAVGAKRKLTLKTTSKFRYKSGSIRRKMQKEGLYDIPSNFSNHPIIIGFYNHMIDVRQKPKEYIKNSVQNICRILYQIMGPKSQIKPELITKHSIKPVVDKLKDVPLSNQTIANYLKSLIMFLKYLRDVADITDDRPDESGRLNRLVVYCKEMKMGYNKSISEGHHIKQTTLFPTQPPNLFEVAELSRKLEPIANVLFEKAKSKTVLKQFEVSKINAYIAADIGLNQGRRPGELSNLQKAEYDLALRDPRFHNNEILGVPCARHKTSKKYTAMIMLDSRQQRYFNIYSNYIRKSIVFRSKTTCQHFLLQYDGNPFYKVTVAINRYQIKYNLPKIDFTLSRKSIQTYNQNLSITTQAQMNICMTHTEKTRDKNYRIMDIKAMAESRRVIDKLQLYFSQHKQLHIAPSSDELARVTLATP